MDKKDGREKTTDKMLFLTAWSVPGGLHRRASGCARPRWYRSWKDAIIRLIEGFQAVSLAVIIGIAVGLSISGLPDAAGPNPPVPQHATEAPAKTVLADTPATQEEAGEETAGTGAEETEPFKPAGLVKAGWEGASNTLPWWGITAVLAIPGSTLLGLWLLRRRTEVEDDSPEFTRALREVAAPVHDANPTPRAIRLFENKMRYISAREDAAVNPERPDMTDMLFRRWLPPDYFIPEPLRIDGRSLAILVAERIIVVAGRVEPEWMKTSVLSYGVDGCMCVGRWPVRLPAGQGYAGGRMGAE
ncbi:MAG: hypothetical protein QM682_12465 [Paracoccus sp. (in: a-proteobacteria)]|uniref:hypothetical protein n=1 Tax=Paracoccus sp. TaxID=267 RepID=UPI0039E69559